MSFPDPRSFALGVLVGSGAVVLTVWIVADDVELSRSTARELQPPAAQAMGEGDRAFTPAGSRGRRSEARTEPAEEQAAPRDAPGAAPGTAAAPGWKLQTAKQIHFHQMSEEQLLRVFTDSVRTRDLKTAAAAVDQLRKRFKGTEIPVASVLPEMQQPQPHLGIVQAAIASWHRDTLLAYMERAAETTGTEAEAADWRFAGSVVNGLMALRANPPPWVVTKLLRHPRWPPRFGALVLVKFGADADPAEVVRLLSDPNDTYRMESLRALVVLARRHPRVVRESKLREMAVRDESVGVRVEALAALSNLAREGAFEFPAEFMLGRAAEGGPRERATAIRSLTWHLHEGTKLPREQVTELVVGAARSDPDPQVREAAIENLEYLGPAGADVAMELLETPGFSASDSVESAVWAAVLGGRGAEILEMRASPEIALYAIDAVRSLDEEEHPHALRDLSSSIGPVLAWREIYAVPDGQDVVANLMEAAVEDKVPELAVQVATDRHVPSEVRRRAVESLLYTRETHASGFAVAKQLLRDRSTPAELRIGSVEALGDTYHDEEIGVDREAVRAELVRTAKDDPSFYVRDAARVRLEDIAEE